MSLIVIFAIAILLGLVNSAWATGTPKQSGDVAVFAASVSLRMCLFVGGGLFLFLAVGFAYKLGPKEAWPWSLIFFALAVCAIIGWPPTIVVDAHQVKQLRFLRAPIVIAKTDIESIEHDARTHKTSIVSTKGDRITHERFHVASADFQKQLSAWHRISQIQ